MTSTQQPIWVKLMSQLGHSHSESGQANIDRTGSKSGQATNQWIFLDYAEKSFTNSILILQS